MSEIVRGRTVHATLSYDRVELEIAAEDHAKVRLNADYLLIPDDGNRVVVTVEEWERREALLREIWDTVPSTYDPHDCTVKEHARALNKIPKLLGTNGGESK